MRVPDIFLFGASQHLAKEILQSRKAVTRLYTNKAHMMSLGTQLTEQMGQSIWFGMISHQDVYALGQAGLLPIVSL